MEKLTNININSRDKTFMYLLGYEQITDSYYDADTFPLSTIYDDCIYLLGKSTNCLRDNNEWHKRPIPKASDLIIPDKYKIANIQLYFPSFSANTFDSVDYALDVYTYVRGIKISLGSYIINRLDALAIPVKKRGEQTYCESISFQILDPYYILYSDDWSNFRSIICNETILYDGDEQYSLNNECPTLHFSLYPVVKDSNDIYTTSINYTGGQNSLNISNPEYFRFSIKPDIETGETIKISGKLYYNSQYSNVLEYIKETYDIMGGELSRTIADIEAKLSEINDINDTPPYITDIHVYEEWANVITYEFAVCDKNDIYLQTPKFSFVFKEELPDLIENQKNYISTTSKYELKDTGDGLNEHIEIGKDHIYFDNWVGYHEGMFIVGTLNIQNGDKEISIRSNKIPLTPELFKYFVTTDTINNVDKNIIDEMSINIVNKIVNNVIQLDNINDSKSNIIQPVFFRSYDLNNIVVHPMVTENICINLDIYKSKVDRFMLQIDGKSFLETGRTSSGVVFKIIGSKLNKTQNTNVYYILNENGDVITTGKYNYEI